MNKKLMTEKEFQAGVEKLRRRPALRELLRPQAAFPDRKKEEARRRCRKKPGAGTPDT